MMNDELFIILCLKSRIVGTLAPCVLKRANNGFDLSVIALDLLINAIGLTIIDADLTL